jgi:broad specificity phosphatase PhoE
MNRVVLVRHGQTTWSAEGRHTGWTDLALTEAGERQGKALGEMLSDYRFAGVLTSPLARAQRTSELAGFGAEAEAEPDLMEWDYGDYEGRTTADIRNESPGWSVWTHPIPGGESLSELAARADRVIGRIRETEGDVLLFGHGHALRVLAVRWLNLEPKTASGFVLETAALGILGWERDHPAILRWNEISHLRASEELY